MLTTHRGAAAAAVSTLFLLLPSLMAGPAAAQDESSEIRVTTSTDALESGPVPGDLIAQLEAPSDEGEVDHDHAGQVRAKGGSVAQTSAALDGRSEMVVVQPVDASGAGIERAELAFRSRTDGAWSDWVVLHTDPEEGPDALPGGEGGGTEATAGRGAVGPIWVGEGTDEVQMVLLEGAAAAIRTEALDAPEIGDPGADAKAQFQARTSASWGGQPAIRPNSAWGSPGYQRQTSGCASGPRYSSNLRAMVVHHTVTTNSYTQAEVPKLLLGIHRFHTVTRGWCDVAYNFLVDRFGTIWEGRSGGIDRPVIGGHARGFNEYTFAVSLLGQHQSNISSPAGSRPTDAALQAVRAVGAWKLRLHGIDPNGTTLLKNTASGGVLKHPYNEYVEVPTIMGHRELGETSCPGNLTLPVLDAMRAEFTPRHSGTVPYIMPGVTGDDFGPKLMAVDTFGGLRPALGQAAPANPPGAGAAAIAVGGTATAGFVLAADGTLRPYGNAPAVAGRPGGPNPVDLIVRDSGKSGYVVTADGRLHGFGGQVVDRASVGGGVIAGDVNDDKVGYTVTPGGELRPVHQTPAAVLNARPSGRIIDIVVWKAGTSGYVLTDIGEVIGFGQATNFGDVVPTTPVAVVAGPNQNGGWVLDTEGRWWNFGDERPVVPASTNRGKNIAVDAVLTGYDLTGSQFKKSSDFRYIEGAIERVRQADARLDEIDHWNWKIDHKGTIALGNALVRSNFFTEAIVRDMYSRALGRDADAKGLAYWTGLLNSRQVSVREMGVYFYGSEELYQRSGNPDAYVVTLYRALLHRDPDESGRKYWGDLIRTRRATIADVTSGFYESLESRRDRVDALYQRLAGTTPSSAAREQWAERLIRVDDLTLAAEIIAGPTYYRFLTS